MFMYMRAYICEQVEGWSLLAEAQSALAHSCIVSYYTHSAKFEHLFAAQLDLTQSLQQRMEEAWVALPIDPPPLFSADAFGGAFSEDALPAASATAVALPFPKEEAKHAIRQLRQRLKDYLLTVQTEIFLPASEEGRVRGREARASARVVRRHRREAPTLPLAGGGVSVGSGGRNRVSGDSSGSGSGSGTGRAPTSPRDDVVVFGQQLPIQFEE